MVETVIVPAYEFHYDIIVYPLPYQPQKKVLQHFMIILLRVWYELQGESFFYLLMEQESLPAKTKRNHWLELLHDHVYCFIPSVKPQEGQVQMYTSMPEFLMNYHWIELRQVCYL